MMRILDYIIYYTALYFTRNSYLLTWSTAVERACYAATIMTGFWIYTCWEIVVDYILKETNKFDLPTFPMIIVGIFILLLYQFIYVNGKRYEIISSDNYRKFRVTDKNGILIVAIFSIISFFLPVVLAIITGITHKR